MCIIPAEPIDRRLAAAGPFTGDTHSFQSCGQRSTPLSKHLAPDDRGNLLQRGSYKTVSGCINGQFVEATIHFSPIKQSMSFGIQKVYVPPNASEDRLSRLIAETQVPPDTSFHFMRQDFGNQVRDIVGIVFHGNLFTVDILNRSDA
jgi:hypothetical protein